MIKLDSLDTKVLIELDRNSRQSVSSIAKKLKQGRDRIEYRIERFINEGLITNFEVVVDLYKLGFNFYKSYFKLESDSARISELKKHLQNHPAVYWYSSCDGEWDLIVVMLARSAHEFYKAHLDIMSAYSDIILNFHAYTSVGVTIFSRSFGSTAEQNKFSHQCKEFNLSYDQTDLDILRVLSKSARASQVEIAEAVGCSPNIAAYRIERMEKLGIIMGYRLGLGLDKFGMTHFKSQLFLRNYDLSLRREFLKYCDAHPNIIYYIKQIGDCNIEIELEVGGYQEYYRIMEEIRAKFSMLIRSFNTMIIREGRLIPVPAIVGRLPSNKADNISSSDNQEDHIESFRNLPKILEVNYGNPS